MKNRAAGRLRVMQGDPENGVPGLADWTDKILTKLEDNPSRLLDRGSLNDANTLIIKKLKDAPAPCSDFDFTEEGAVDYTVSTAILNWEDNVLTISRIVESFWIQMPCTTDAEKVQLVSLLSSHRPQIKHNGKDLNYRNETWLKILARAPFGYYGNIRNFAADLQSENIVPDIKNPDNLIPTELVNRILNETRNTSSQRNTPSLREERYGPCPALDPRFKNLNLINRLGAVYAKTLETWYTDINGAMSLAPFKQKTVRKVKSTIECPHKS